jgi:hypothetical protein
MDFGKLLERSWRIVWRNKFMFVLGFMAALGSGGGSGGNSNFSFSPPSGSASFDIPYDTINSFQQFWAQFGTLVIGVMIFAILIGLVFWLLRLVGQGGLISAAATIDAGENVTFGQAFSEGTRFFGRMLGLNITMYGLFFLGGLVFFLIFLGMFIPLISAEIAGEVAGFDAMARQLGLVGVCFGILACLSAPVLLIVNVVYPFAQRGLVLRDMGIIESIKHGWGVVRAHASDIFLLIILFIAIGFGFGIIMIIVLIPFAFLAMGPAIFSIITGEMFEALDVILIVVGSVCIGVVGAAVNSIMITFRSTTVTLAYQEFAGKAEKAVV